MPAIDATAQQPTANASAAQESLRTFKGLLEELQADPENPQVWYKLGLTLSQMPGYNAPASVWLEAYLLAVPNEPNAGTVRTQIKNLSSTSARAEPLATQLEMFALDSRASTYDRLGKTDLAIADFKRILQLNPQQEHAKEALKRLSVTPKPAEKLALPSASTSTPTGRENRGPSCRNIVGTWTWYLGFSVVVFDQDGTARHPSSGSAGKWTCVGTTGSINWGDRTDRMTVSRDGNSLSVTSPWGGGIAFTSTRRSQN